MMVRLDTICSINMGASPNSSTYNDKGEGLPFYQGNADFGEKHPTTRIWCKAPVKIAQEGDVLISVRAPIGALNVAAEQCSRMSNTSLRKNTMRFRNVAIQNMGMYY